MKKFSNKIVILLMITMLLFVFVACGDDDDNDSSKSAGDLTDYTTSASEISFKTVFVPGGITFPTGTDDAGVATVTKSYEIGETPVTYELWYAVYSWATNNGYSFVNAGREGHDGDIGAVPTIANTEPVTTMNWREAMVWCNALTEFYNAKKGTSLSCVYYSDGNYANLIKATTDVTGITHDTPGSQDSPYIKATVLSNIDINNIAANGFRLLTISEWELAARHRGSDSENTVTGYSDPYFTKGNSASGATNDYTDDVATKAMGWYDDNSVGITYGVKSKPANSLGVYGMNGSTWGIFFDLNTVDNGYHAFMGCAYGMASDRMQLGFLSYLPPFTESETSGFRIGRTP